MFELLQPTQTDPLIALIGAFKEDPRPYKIDVGVGVYRDHQGRTPVMAAVKIAERHLLETQDSKTYLGLVGDANFNMTLSNLVFGAATSSLAGRLRAVQTTGGCGALRALADLVAASRPGATVWVSCPTWGNHFSIFKAAGLNIREYPYLNTQTQQVDFEGMAAALRQVERNDVVLIHGCCHNPSGADLSNAQWDSIAQLAAQQGFLPLIDLAYAGLGLGLDEDTYGVRCLAQALPELLIAVSCSKNFGLYRDRVGCAMVLSSNSSELENAFSHILMVLRGNYSMPPDHGAAVVAYILSNKSLFTTWCEELNTMRNRINQLRHQLADRFASQSGESSFEHIRNQRGMFSLLGLSNTQVATLRADCAIYMPNDSRTNIAGLNADQVDRFVTAVLDVRSTTNESVH